MPPCSVRRVVGLESETEEEEEEEEQRWSDGPITAPHSREPRPPPRSLRATRRKAASKEVTGMGGGGP